MELRGKERGKDGVMGDSDMQVIMGVRKEGEPGSKL